MMPGQSVKVTIRLKRRPIQFQAHRDNVIHANTKNSVDLFLCDGPSRLVEIIVGTQERGEVSRIKPTKIKDAEYH